MWFSRDHLLTDVAAGWALLRVPLNTILAYFQVGAFETLKPLIIRKIAKAPWETLERTDTNQKNKSSKAVRAGFDV